jgi:hypothetical protein
LRGWALALAHAKSGDAALIAGYCGKSDALDDAFAKSAISYARQTEQNYEALMPKVDMTIALRNVRYRGPS